MRSGSCARCSTTSCATAPHRAGWAWPGVPYATACAGATEYGSCTAGLPRAFHGGIEPDKIGELGLAYLKFYELTGETRFLRAGVQSADVLARHVRDTGDARTPWAFEVDARTGRTLDGAEFGGAVVGPLSLLDEALRLHVGATATLRAARDRALRWLIGHQLNPASPDWNRWTGFYEDVPYNPAGRNQAVPMLTAEYLIAGGAAVDPRWQQHARALVAWVRDAFRGRAVRRQHRDRRAGVHRWAQLLLARRPRQRYRTVRGGRGAARRPDRRSRRTTHGDGLARVRDLLLAR